MHRKSHNPCDEKRGLGLLRRGCVCWAGQKGRSLGSKVTTLERQALPCHLLLGGLGQPSELRLLGILAGSEWTLDLDNDLETLGIEVQT